MTGGNPELLDPVAAYDCIAPFYKRGAETRQAYLESVEHLVMSRIPPGSASLLDIGAGDGIRTLRIAAAANLRDIVLLEPSSEMVRNCRASEIWAIRAEELASHEPANARKFDVITILWNVLGHIRPAATRARALDDIGRMLSPNGVLLVDVNHRYNARSYGLFKTIGRFVRDQLLPGERNGDVTAHWSLGSKPCSTYGHVFTDKEMRDLAAAANLTIKERVVVDYETGAVKRFALQGSLFYVYQKKSSEAQSR